MSDPPQRTSRPRRATVATPTITDIDADIVESRRFAREQIERILRAFFVLNGVVIGLVAIIAAVEMVGLSHSPRQIITTSVVTTLIGASAVQLGALALSVGRGLLNLGGPPLPSSARPPT